MPWFTQGRITNPAAGAVLADTGPLIGGPNYQPQAIVSSTIAAQILIQRRNATNTANVSEQLVVCPANSTFTLPLVVNMSETWQDDERVRLVINATINGTIQASLLL